MNEASHKLLSIRFCVNNPRSLAERNALIQAGYECRDCLSNCTRCFETRFLEIDGGLIEGASYEQILEDHNENEA